MSIDKEKQIRQLEAQLKIHSDKLGNLITQGKSMTSPEVSRVLRKIETTKSKLSRAVARKNQKDKKADFKRRLDIADIILEYLATDPLMAHLGGFEHLEKVTPAPAVLKKDDPAGYERYKAYRAFTKRRNEIASDITPVMVKKWVKEHKNATGFPSLFEESLDTDDTY